MIRKILLGIAGLAMVLAAVLTVNTLTYGPPLLPKISQAAAVSVNNAVAAKRLGQAIRFRTISYGANKPVDGQAFQGLHRYLADTFPKVQASLKREIISDYSLLYTWQGSTPSLKPILLAAHLDVVPVQPGSDKNWIHPPFDGVVADGFIWGRGALDDKVSALGILEGVEFLLGSGFTPKRTVYLAFGHDEEVGGPKGAAAIAATLAKRGVRLDFTLDEGLVVAQGILAGVKPPVALIGIAEKGFLTLELTAKVDDDKCGHSSMPPRGTAIAKLARAIHRLETNPMPAMLRTPAAEMFEYLAPEMPIPQRVVLANRWLLESLLLSLLEGGKSTNAMIRTTIVPTILSKSGVKENVIPCEAKAILNSRILPGDSIDGVIKHVNTIINDSAVSVHPYGDQPTGPSPVSSTKSSGFATLRKTVRQVFPRAVVAPGLVIAGTDSKHYERIADNSYRFLPTRVTSADLSRFHGTNERLAIDNYAEIIRFYVQLLRNSAAEQAGLK